MSSGSGTHLPQAGVSGTDCLGPVGLVAGVAASEADEAYGEKSTAHCGSSKSWPNTPITKQATSAAHATDTARGAHPNTAKARPTSTQSGGTNDTAAPSSRPT